MKKTSAFTLTLLVLSLFSCKKECFQNAIVVKDCTGTYLQMGGKDYKVCNFEKLTAYDNGTMINFTHKDLGSCGSSEKGEPVCSISHPSAGWMEVEKIK